MHENIYDALEPRKVQLFLDKFLLQFPFAVRKLSCFVTVTSILSSAIYFVLAITVQNCKSPVTLGCIQKLYYSTTFYIENFATIYFFCRNKNFLLVYICDTGFKLCVARFVRVQSIRVIRRLPKLDPCGYQNVRLAGRFVRVLSGYQNFLLWIYTFWATINHKRRLKGQAGQILFLGLANIRNPKQMQLKLVWC
jgi:hypothetical protein